MYTLNDLKAQQDWVMEHEFRRSRKSWTSAASAAPCTATKSSPIRTACGGAASRWRSCRTRAHNSKPKVGGDMITRGTVS